MTSTHTPRIVVGVDGSEPSQQALRWAAQLAVMSGARIEAVAAWEYPAMYGWAPGPDWDPGTDADKLLTATVDEVFGTSRPADMRHHQVRLLSIYRVKSQVFALAKTVASIRRCRPRLPDRQSGPDARTAVTSAQSAGDLVRATGRALEH